MCQAKSINLKGEATKDTRLMSATKDQDEDNSEEIVEMSFHYTIPGFGIQTILYYYHLFYNNLFFNIIGSSPFPPYCSKDQRVD